MMKRFVLSLVLAIVLPVMAFAHSTLKASNPANGEKLAKAPEEIEFTFTKPARLIKVVLVQKNDGTTTERKLKIPSRDLVKTISVPSKIKTPGTYEVQWRALSEDGHVIKNTFGFQVSGS